MAVTVQMQFESAVTELYEDVFIGSSIENGTTIIQFDLRKHDFQQELGTQATLGWRQESYQVDVHELATFHNPIKYRFIVAQGAYLNGQHQRVYFTPDIKGVSTSQHMSHGVIRLACYLAVVCGGQSPAHCAPFCRTVPDSYYQVIDQTLDGCHWDTCAHPRGDAAAVTCHRPCYRVSH